MHIEQIWKCPPGGPKLEHEFNFTHGAVLAIVPNGDTIFAGCQDGYVKVLDLETKTLIRTIIVEEVRLLNNARIPFELNT